MKMKRYFAPDSRQALRALRDEQGPDAVILSNRKVSGGVEIIAAMDYEDAMHNAEFVDGAVDYVRQDSDQSMEGNNGVTITDGTKKDATNTGANTIEAKQTKPRIKAKANKYDSSNTNRQTSTTDKYSQQTNNIKTSLRSENINNGSSFVDGRNVEKLQKENSVVLNKIQGELADLKNIMEAPMMQFSWAETNRVQPLLASLLKQLMSLGLSSKLSQNIAKNLANEGLHKDSWQESVNQLAHLVPVSEEDIIENGGIVSLVGPTGVGKTTTIAKLAARFALKHGRRDVTLITTDNYRIGAHEQLRSYGRILGIPVHVASDSEELKNILKEVNAQADEHQLTLIDTAGISQKDMVITEQMTSIEIEGIDIQNYLVLSATGQMNLQDQVVRAFSKINLQGCVITKIDEAASLGEVISVIIQHDLPVSFLCDGQKVPDDLHYAKGDLIVNEAVRLMSNLNKSLSDEELAYTFGGVMNNASF